VIKYRYVRVTRKFVLFFCIFSLFVVGINIIGLYRYGYISIPNFLLALSSFLGTLLTTVYITSGYKEFNLIEHDRLIMRLKGLRKNKLPKIDVFLPCAGEDLKILERTYDAVSKIDYPPEKTHVYVLDDGGDFGVEQLVRKYGFHYLSRPNKGEKKKAGNLKYGFEHSSGKYILILDADFAPEQEIISELLPYPETDKNVGIVQSPQDFVLNKSEPMYVQKGDIGVQEFFYRICEVARNTYNASICVGTNALYRREALLKSGGFYQIEHSEDSHTGISLVKSGYRILYIPIILATGYCPSNYYQLFKQRSRWCLGSLSLMRSKLFWETRLNFMARLCYFSGFYYYLNSFVVMLWSLHTLYLLATPAKSSLTDVLFFLPNILYLFLSYTTFYYPRFNFSVLGNQFFYYWTYLFVTMKEFIFGRKEEWVATGTAQSKNTSYKILLVAIFAYIVFYWSWFISIAIRSNFNFVLSDSLLVFWIAYNMICHISFIVGLIVSTSNRFRASRENKEPLINLASIN
jgi:cellulose synthase (UDP-forming)